MFLRRDQWKFLKKIRLHPPECKCTLLFRPERHGLDKSNSHTQQLISFFNLSFDGNAKNDPSKIDDLIVSFNRFSNLHAKPYKIEITPSKL